MKTLNIRLSRDQHELVRRASTIYKAPPARFARYALVGAAEYDVSTGRRGYYVISPDDAPLHSQLTVRLPSEELDLIRQAAAGFGLPVGVYARFVLIGIASNYVEGVKLPRYLLEIKGFFVSADDGLKRDAFE